MTLRNILYLAALRTIVNEDYIAWIRKRDQEKPNLSDDQIRAQLSDLVITLIASENEFIMRIVKEIPKGDLQQIVKDIVTEYATAENSDKVVKKPRKKIRNAA